MPQKRKYEPRSETIKVRTTPSVASRLEALAQSQNQSVSHLAHLHLKSACGEKPTTRTTNRRA